jgi:hypothetical protein
MGGVVDILVVDAYSGMELCTPIFLGESSNKFREGKMDLKRFQNSKRTHTLTKLN